MTVDVHPIVAAVADALATHPTCPHITVTTIAQSGRCDACTATLATVTCLKFAAIALMDHAEEFKDPGTGRDYPAIAVSTGMYWDAITLFAMASDADRPSQEAL